MGLSEVSNLKPGTKLWLYIDDRGAVTRSRAVVRIGPKAGRLGLDVDVGDRHPERWIWSLRRNRLMRDGGPLVGKGEWLELRDADD